MAGIITPFAAKSQASISVRDAGTLIGDGTEHL
jgi:hypothetical protein